MRSGYLFTGWYKDALYETIWDFTQDTVDGDMNLYAGWEPDGNVPGQKTYTVSFDLQGHGNMVDAYREVVEGSTIPEPETPKEEGCVFIGWYKEAACIEQWDFAKDTVMQDLILYAGWKVESLGDVIISDVPDDNKIPDGIWIPYELHDGVRYIKDRYVYTYTGNAVKPVIPRVYYGNDLLMPGIDYTISYKNNINVNAIGAKRPEVTVKGKKHCPGTATVYFNIEAADLEDTVVENLALIYNGKVQKKVPKVTYNGKKLTKGKDFDVIWDDEGYQEAGVYSVTFTVPVSGKSCNFKGTKTAQITILEKADKNYLISKARVAKIPKQFYQGGEPVELDSEELRVFAADGTELSLDEEYEVEYMNNRQIGTATILIKGIEPYAGTKKATFKIVKTSDVKSLKKATVTFGDHESRTWGPVVYNGEEQVPEVHVYLSDDSGESELEKDSDYTVTYSGNYSAGKAIITIKGMGWYTGTVKKSFRITPCEFSEKDDGFKLSIIEESMPGNLKKGYQPSVVLTYKGRRLWKGKDYTVSYKNNKKPGTPGSEKPPTVTITGRGSFRGKFIRTFSIVE